MPLTFVAPSLCPVRKKTVRVAEYHTLPHVIAHNPHWAGQWQAQLHTTLPLVLELGCGRAEFALALAQLQPHHYFIGIDSKPDRLWAGAQVARQLQLPNLRLLREDIFIASALFAPAEVQGIWITFPDPYPKVRHARRRLTSPYFLEQYARILVPGACVQFKTDNAALFDYTLAVLQQLGISPLALTRDLHHSPYLNDETGCLTTYERRFMALGLPIHYLRFAFST